MRSVASLWLCCMLLPTVGHGQWAPEELAERRNALMAQLPDALVIVPSRWDLKDDTELGFQQDNSFYYLTGLSNAIGALLLLDGAAREATLFVADERSGVQFFHAAVPVGDSTAERLGLTRVVGVEGFRAFLDTLIAQRSDVTVLVADERPLVAGIPGVGEVANRGATLRSALQARWPRLQVDTLGPELRHLRAIKSPQEIERMRRAGSAAVEALLAGVTAVAPGKTQREAEVAIAGACFRAGADGLSWWPWAQTGPNALFPATFRSMADYHHLNRVMESGELARLDVGCQYDHYQSDVGRTVPVSGRWTEGQRETWDLLIAGYRASLDTIRGGVTVEAVRTAFETAVRQRQAALRTPLARAAAVILLDRKQSPFWQVHGVGLEPGSFLGPMLRTGMVVALEPMFVVEAQGFYLEDMLLVTDEGSELLTPNLPYTAQEIEEAMASR